MPNPDPAHPDPRLAVWLAPEDIRAHFEETDAEPRAAALSDAALADAAWCVIADSDRLWALFDELCLDVLERAAGNAS